MVVEGTQVIVISCPEGGALPYERDGILFEKFELGTWLKLFGLLPS